MKTIFIVYLVSVLAAIVLGNLNVFIIQKILKHRGVKLCKGSEPVWVGRLINVIKCLIPIYNVVLSFSLLVILCSAKAMERCIEQIIEVRGTKNF